MKHRGFRRSRSLAVGLIVLGLGLLTRDTDAQALWNPTDGRAKPVAILAADISMTSFFDIREENKARSKMNEERTGGGGCYTACHDRKQDPVNPSLSRYHLTALFQGLDRIRGITEEFEEQFVWGGFVYSGALHAQVVSRSFPEPAAMQQSFSNVFGGGSNSLLEYKKLLSFLGRQTTNRITHWKPCPWPFDNHYCKHGTRTTRNFETGEHRLPPEAVSSSAPEPNGCLMPDESGACQYDDDALAALVQSGLQGLTLPVMQTASMASFTVPAPATCDVSGAPEESVDPLEVLARELTGGGWPHWTDVSTSGIVPEQRVQEGICEPFERAFKALDAELTQCLSSPAAFMDLSFLSQGTGAWCDATTIREHICTAGPLKDSCLCRPGANPKGCKHTVGKTLCGTNISVRRGRPGRHQWALCEMSSENSDENSIGRWLKEAPGQFDNVMNDPAGRENVSIFYTDGYMGGIRSGYDAHMGNPMDMSNPNAPLIVGEYMRHQAKQTLDGGFWTTSAQSKTSNLFVLNHLRDRFVTRAKDRLYTPGSHRFQEVLLDPEISRPHPPPPGMTKDNAWGIPDANKSLPAIDTTQLRASLRKALNRAMAGAYRGAQPALDRKAELIVFHDFSVFGPKKTGMAAEHPGEDFVPHPSRLSFHRLSKDGGKPELICETDWQDRANQQLAGESTAWAADTLSRYSHPIYSNPNHGLVRNLGGSILDRDGDGRADAHPALTLGKMAGGKSTTPVVVGAPVEIPLGADAQSFAEFMLAARTRPQVAYVMSNGFIHGFHAGAYQAVGGGFFGGPKSFAYDLGSADLCKELWRHRPGWVSEREVIEANTTQARQLMDGPMVAAEVRVGYAGRASDYKTLLVAAQGKMGAGMVALDVTDPRRPSVFRTWSLPIGARATSMPVVAEAVSGVDGKLRPMVFMSGGYRGVPALHAHDLASGEAASISLPGEAGEDYPTAPVCFDRDGRGGVTHCYVLSRFGRVVRAAILPSGAVRGSPDPVLTERQRLRAQLDGCVQNLEPDTGLEAPRLALAGDGRDDPCADAAYDPVRDAPPPVGTAHVALGEVRDISPAGLPDLGAEGKRFYVSPTAYFDDRNQVNLVFGSGDVKEMQRPARIQNYVYKLVEPGRAAWRATLAKTCAPAGGGSEDGLIPLPEGYMMVSPAAVSSGVVTFTAYRPPESAMKRGTSVLYGMNYASCADAYSGAGRPEARSIGEGLPGTPVLLPDRKMVLAATTLRSGEALHVESGAKPVADGRVRLRRLYWRPLTSDRATAPVGGAPRRVLPELIEGEPTFGEPEPSPVSPTSPEPIRIR